MPRHFGFGATSLVGVCSVFASISCSVAQETDIEDLESQILLLEQAIIERDAIIIDLLNRVRKLEEGQLADPVEQTEFVEEPRVPELGLAPPAANHAGITDVDPEDAERALDVSLVNVGGLLLAPGRLQLAPSVSYLRTEQNIPSLVGGTQVSIGEQESDRDIVDSGLGARLGLPWDSQIDFTIPGRIVRQEGCRLRQ